MHLSHLVFQFWSLHARFCLLWLAFAVQEYKPCVCWDEENLSFLGCAKPRLDPWEHCSSPSNLMQKAGEAGGRKTHLEPWTMYSTSLETEIRISDSVAMRWTTSSAEPLNTLLKPCFSSSIMVIQPSYCQAMQIHDLASSLGNIKTITLKLSPEHFLHAPPWVFLWDTTCIPGSWDKYMRTTRNLNSRKLSFNPYIPKLTVRRPITKFGLQILD